MVALTGHDPVAVEVAGLRLDPGQRRVWRDGDEATLTARKVDLLQFLLRRAGRVFSKDEILAGVWDLDFEGDPNIVEVYIGRLRRKLGEPGARHRIETVRGAGYRLVGDDR